VKSRHATALETVWVEVPEEALETYEAAFAIACETVGFFIDDATGAWRVEGVKPRGEGDAQLAGALALADAASGTQIVLQRTATEAEGWLARTYAAFPEQRIGHRFAVRGSHLPSRKTAGRITIVLDAGLAFGSGEHGSTRGCLRALERVASRRPRRVLDLGTGSGILAIAAAKLLHRPVIATDIEPWSVRVTRENARRNGVGALVRPYLAHGWRQRPLTSPARFDLVFANILARPLSHMAPSLSAHLRPGGHAVLAGLLFIHVPMVLAAHRRAGLHLVARYEERPWTTLLLRKPPLVCGRPFSGA
jgi:ribosomal protein L11 methyltransferase